MKNLITAVLIFLFSYVKAQTIEGYVYFSNGEPASYVTTTILHKNIGSITDDKGHFSIQSDQITPEDTLIIRFIGCKTIYKPVNQIDGPLKLTLKQNNSTLGLVVIKSENYNPLQLLKKVVKEIPNNYQTSPFNFEGFYAEVLRENGVAIKYTDAVASFYYEGYSDKKTNKDEFVQSNEPVNTISEFTFDWCNSLHRGHFPIKTLKTDQSQIQDGRSSLNLTTKDFFANIEGGPLGLLSKDIMKFRFGFIDKKGFRKYNYALLETTDSVGTPYYLVKFQSARDENKLIQLNLKSFSLLEGEIWIKKSDKAVTKVRYMVRNDLKKHLCSCGKGAVNHYDHYVELNYEQQDDTYFLSQVIQRDQFIIEDTAGNVTPYDAEIILRTYNHSTANVAQIPAANRFYNSSMNHMYDYAMAYDPEFWSAYFTDHPEFQIPAVIRKDMETEQTLEEQFALKHMRDTSVKAPIARVEPLELKKFDVSLTDNYAWMKQTKDVKSNDSIMNYLVAENKYYTNYIKPFKTQQKFIYNKLVSIIPKTEKSIPTIMDGYEYYVVSNSDFIYSIYCRKNISTQVVDTLINPNKLAKKNQNFSIGETTISPSQKLLGYSYNTNGSDLYTFKFKHIKTNAYLTDSLTNATEAIFLDDSTIIYVEQDPITLRSYKVKLHSLGSSQSMDTTLYTEKDKEYAVGLERSKDKKMILLSVSSKSSNEIWFSTAPSTKGFKCIHPREKDITYSVTLHKDQFFIRTNWGRKDGVLMVTDTTNYEQQYWQAFEKKKSKGLIGSIQIFDDYIAIEEYIDLQPNIKIINRKTLKSHYIELARINELPYVGLGQQLSQHSESVMVIYSSVNVPTRTLLYNMRTKEFDLIKQEKKHSNSYNDYFIDIIEVPTKDGVTIPMTIKYNPLAQNKSKVIVRSYGAYGVLDMGVSYSPIENKLMDLGFVFVDVHVRGEGTRGPEWHEQGSMLNKMNSFNDLITSVEWLLANNYAIEGTVTLQGGSAGGLLVGAVANMRPDLFKTVILEVPFVDVLNTMLDASLPLTTGEYQEWGNPNEEEYFKYILSYSPYENVQDQNYPNMVFFTGINDSRVGYWEAAKMVAKLRALSNNKGEILLKTDLYSGHGGSSNRFVQLQTVAEKYALILSIRQ